MFIMNNIHYNKCIKLAQLGSAKCTCELNVLMARGAYINTIPFAICTNISELSARSYCCYA